MNLLERALSTEVSENPYAPVINQHDSNIMNALTDHLVSSRITPNQLAVAMKMVREIRERVLFSMDFSDLFLDEDEDGSGLRRTSQIVNTTELPDDIRLIVYTHTKSTINRIMKVHLDTTSPEVGKGEDQAKIEAGESPKDIATRYILQALVDMRIEHNADLRSLDQLSEDQLLILRYKPFIDQAFRYRSQPHSISVYWGEVIDLMQDPSVRLAYHEALRTIFSGIDKKELDHVYHPSNLIMDEAHLWVEVIERLDEICTSPQPIRFL